MIDVELGHKPDAVIAPYYYAGDGEIAWIDETLLCAATARDLLEQRVADGKRSRSPGALKPQPVMTIADVGR